MKKSNPFNEELPVLEAMIAAIPKNKSLAFQEVAFVCVQHFFYTTYSLVEALTRLGAPSDNIHIIGKSYSFCPNVASQLTADGYHCYPNLRQEKLGSFAHYFKQDIERMWQAVYQDLQKKEIKLIVILDDGGSCLTSIPLFITEKYPLIGIEQTTSGLTNPLIRRLSFPVIEVASSAAKQLIESPMIADAVVRKLTRVLPLNKKRLSCGVVGLGVIGRSVAQKLISLNHRVMTYDKNPERNQFITGAIRASNIDTLVHESEYVFGCSGEDMTESLDISSLKKDTSFISCSSQDKEFLSLLKTIQHLNYSYTSLLDHILYTVDKGLTIKIFHGGFPINLDNSGESVKSYDIQLTRGLLLGGILQGILYASQQEIIQTNFCYMLHPAIQAFVTSYWLHYGSTHLFNLEFLSRFQDSDWIKKHSGGIFQENEFISQCFRCTVPFTLPSVKEVALG
jgi:S-adenosylhomocysteine hydrolase